MMSNMRVHWDFHLWLTLDIKYVDSFCFIHQIIIGGLSGIFSCSKKICVSKVDKNKSKTGILKTAILMKIIIVLIRVWVVLKRRSQSNLIICKKKNCKTFNQNKLITSPQTQFIYYLRYWPVYLRSIYSK